MARNFVAYTRYLEAAHSKDFVTLPCTVLIQITSVTDRQTDGWTDREMDRHPPRQRDGQTPRRWLRRAKHSAVARKNRKAQAWSDVIFFSNILCLLIIRDVVSVETSRSRDVLTSCLGLEPMRLGSRLGSRFSLEAICLGLGPISLVLGLEPLRLVETFCAGARRACCSCS